jgi:hypothetical protein
MTCREHTHSVPPTHGGTYFLAIEEFRCFPPDPPFALPGIREFGRQHTTFCQFTRFFQECQRLF